MSKLVVTVATFASLLTQTLALESVDAVRLHMTLQSDSNTAGGSTACDGDCTREYLPVCGTNGETYANDCLLEFAHCQDASVTKKSDGKCQ